MSTLRSGELYTCGDGGNGRLGHGDIDDELVPRHVEGIDPRALTHPSEPNL